MRELPDHTASILVRTCFTRPDDWRRLQQAFVTPSTGDGFLPDLDEVDDPAWEHASPEDVLAAAGELRVVVVADERALSEPGFPALVLRREGRQVHRVRAIAAHMWAIENNLSLFNMDFEEFIRAADDDGVFHGFE